jgi:hypothetical protein
VSEESPRPYWASGGPAVDAALARFDRMGFEAEAAGEIVTSTARAVAERLATAVTRDDVVGATRATAQIASAALRGIRAGRTEKHLPVLTAACARGCAHCCKVHVSISAPEALVLAAFFEDTLPAGELAALRERLARFSDEVRSLDQTARVAAKLACPLLVDDACTAYPVRPLVCAGASSLDATACARALDDPDGAIPLEPLVNGVLRAVQIGLSAAISARGLDVGRYELAGALAVALSPRAAERWLAGERIFSRSAADAPLAVIAPVADAFCERDPFLPKDYDKTRSPAG